MLIGNGLIGGTNANFEIVMMSAKCSACVLVDKKVNTGLVYYIKNIEGSAFPAPPVANSVNTVCTKVSSLFR
jgi:hypothetical protein